MVKDHRSLLKIGTINVRGMCTSGRLAEMERMLVGNDSSFINDQGEYASSNQENTRDREDVHQKDGKIGYMDFKMFSVIFSAIFLSTTILAQTQAPLSTTTVTQPTATAKIKVTFNANSNNGAPSLAVKSAPAGTTVQSNVLAAPAVRFQDILPAVTTNCANGNCGSSPQIITVPSTGCTSGNCNNAAPIVVSAPYYSNGCFNGNCNKNYNTAPIIVQAPSNGCSYGNCNNNAPIVIQAPSTGCYGSNCNTNQPIILPTFNNGCYGGSCGYSGNYSPLLATILGSGSSIGCGSSGCGGYGCGSSGCGSTTNTFSSFGIPDPITTNGNFFRPKVRIPVKYINGNPVFNLAGGYSSYGFGGK